MVSGDTSPSAIVDEYVTNERIALSAVPGGTDYLWSLSVPLNSATARSALVATTDATTSFMPDVAGEYVVSCIVDGATSYVIRISVVANAVTSALGALRLFPLADASVQTPNTGVTLYFSSTQNALVIKKTDGTVHTVTTS